MDKAQHEKVHRHAHHIHESRKIWRAEPEQKEEKKKAPRKKREISPWFMRIVALLLILLVAGSLYLRFQLDTRSVALNVANLRDARLSTIQKSTLVSQTNADIVKIKNPEVSDKWTMLLGCFDDGCDDSVFYGMLYTLAIEVRIPHRKLISDVIITQRYWNTKEELVIFSDALSRVQEGVEELRSSQVRTKWDAVVACDGTCPEKDDLYFDLLRQIIKTE